MCMYNMIIIDDDSREISLLKDVISILDNITLTHTFTDSPEAIEYLNQNNVDIIISDIKMPVYNGIDIAKLCFEKFPKTKVILISAYRDFDYAKSAIKYNVVDYVKKPINIEELMSAIHNAIKSLDNTRVSLNANIFPDDPQELTSNSARYIKKTLSNILLSSDLSEVQKRIRLLLSEFVIDSDILIPDNIDTASSSITAANDVIEKALEYMQNNLDKQLSLTDVAAYVHNNPTYFSRYFKSKLNKKFIDVLVEMKMERAMQLLTTTDYSIAVISNMVGYSSQSYFHTIFQNYYNTTPANARKEANIKKPTLNNDKNETDEDI